MYCASPYMTLHLCRGNDEAPTLIAVLNVF